MESMKTIELYEDNGGGLHLTDGETIWSGLESMRDSGVRDIYTLYVGATDDWTLDSYPNTGTEFDHPETKRIARFDGTELTISPRMGFAAQEYLGIRGMALLGEVCQ